MRIKLKSYLLLIISLVLFLGCEDNKEDDSSDNSCESIYVGTWAHSASGTYENPDCTGGLILDEDFSGSSSLNLSDDCSGTSQDDFFCSDPSENPDMCEFSWSSNIGVITTSAFGGIFQVNYSVDEDSMSTTIVVTQMPDTDDEYTECQYNRYTKQ